MAKPIKKVQNYTVVQANDLIRNKKDFSLWELRVFALLASHVKKEDDDFQTYKFRIKDLLDLFETKSNNLYEELKNIPEKLHAKLIRIPYEDDKGKKRMRRYNLISMSDVPNEENVDEGEYIMLRFDKDLKPLMLKLGEHFTVYKFYNILKLRSPYIFQLYELLKSEEYRGHRSVDIDLHEFRDILQIPASYQFGNIKQRILGPAQKQFIEHTDITFEYTPVKGRGGKIVKLRFRIYKNINTPLQQPEKANVSIEEIESNEANHENLDFFNAMYPRISNWIDQKAFKKLIANYPENQVKNAITYTLNRLKKGDTIQNVAGHIVAMAKQTTLFDPFENQKEVTKTKKEKRQQEEIRKADLEAQKKQVFAELSQKENAIIEAIFLEIPDEREEILKLTKQNRFSHYNSQLSDNENLQSPMFKAAFRNTVKKKFAQRFEALNKKYDSKIKSVNTALSLL